jgi:putative nucleotidyltransferase with HDIG domain
MSRKKKVACIFHDKRTAKNLSQILSKYDFEIIEVEENKFKEYCDNKSIKIDYIFFDMEIQDKSFYYSLRQVKYKYPKIVRILLIDEWNPVINILIYDVIHLALEKDSLENNVQYLVNITEKIRALINNERLIRLINNFEGLPIIKAVYMELLLEFRKKDISINRVTELIEKDSALSSKVLRVSNMSFFAKLVRVTSVKQAVVLLGLNTLRGLIVNLQYEEYYLGKANLYKFFTTLDEHSRRVINYTLHVATALGADESVINDCYASGLLHDIGKMVLFQNSEIWNIIQTFLSDNDVTPYEAERIVLGTSHAEISAYLLSIWGMPVEVVEAVAYHHNPSNSENKNLSVLTYLHVGEALANDSLLYEKDDFLKNLDVKYLKKLGILDKIIEIYDSYFNIDEE